jgi:signal transduction histidine kinase
MVETIEHPTKSEVERLKALRKYAILDTPPEGCFDHIIELSTKLLQVPIAVMSFVDKERIWYKSKVGINLQQVNRDAGFCDTAIKSDDLYIIENTVIDHRTLNNPMVSGELGLRFYAAVPLKIRSGHNLGTLAIMDKRPGSLSPGDKQILKDLAEILVDHLELRLEARQANDRHNQMLGMVAHELKNPLTTIPLYAEMIREKAGSNDPLSQMSNHIIKASERMKVLIKEVLETARLQANEIHLKTTNLNMAMIIGRVAAINIILANSKNQKLYLDIVDNVTIRGDESRMAEIIDNLINNAIKYSPIGSEIRVCLRSFEDKAIFEVIDQGPGFTAEDEQGLFKPFTRLTARPTGGENSTGVGLSIVKLLVEAHGGRVKAENNSKIGARFIIEIPAISETSSIASHTVTR